MGWVSRYASARELWSGSQLVRRAVGLSHDLSHTRGSRQELEREKPLTRCYYYEKLPHWSHSDHPLSIAGMRPYEFAPPRAYTLASGVQQSAQGPIRRPRACRARPDTRAARGPSIRYRGAGCRGRAKGAIRLTIEFSSTSIRASVSVFVSIIVSVFVGVVGFVSVGSGVALSGSECDPWRDERRGTRRRRAGIDLLGQRRPSHRRSPCHQRKQWRQHQRRRA